MKKNIKSSLTLEELFFDKIEFNRKKTKNTDNKDINFKMAVSISDLESNLHSIKLTLNVDKEDEFDAELILVGNFRLEDDYDKKLKQDIITKNTVAIMMPYLRSQLTILTSQPNLEPIIMPILNVNNMFQNYKSEVNV